MKFGKMKKEEEVGAMAEGNSPEPSQEEKAAEMTAPPRYRREGNTYIFSGQEIPVWRPPSPDPAPPEGDDITTFDALPLENVVAEPLGDIPQSRQNKDGVHFSGVLLKLRLKDGSIFSGWISGADFAKYKSWRASFRAKTR